MATSTSKMSGGLAAKDLDAERVNVTSAVLMGAAHYYDQYCEAPNETFVECQTASKDPRKCLGNRKGVGDVVALTEGAELPHRRVVGSARGWCQPVLKVALNRWSHCSDFQSRVGSRSSSTSGPGREVSLRSASGTFDKKEERQLRDKPSAR